MTNEEAIKKMQAVKAHIVSGKPIWSLMGMGEAFDMAIEALKRNRWIPCNERLPEDDRTKIVTLANGNAECGYYSNGDWWCIGDSISLENPTVVAWMPLPMPFHS